MGKDNNHDIYIGLTEEEIEVLEKYKKKKKKWIVGGIIFVAVLLVIIVLYLFFKSESMSGQISEFDKAVNDKDYNKLTEIVGSGEKSISVADAKHFVEYVNEPQNKERYNKEIKKMINDLENNKSYDSKVGRITDKNDNTVIDVSKNGNRFFFLNDLAFVPNFYNVYIKEGNNTASYEFKNNGKQSEVVSNANSKTDLGQFFVGKYELEVTKSFKDKPLSGSVDGMLSIDTDKAGSGRKLEAEEDIPQVWFIVKLKNNVDLDKDYKLLIDGEEVDLEKGKVYGKYPANSVITISAKGRANNSSLETKEVELEANEENKPQTVELVFRDSDIEKHKKINKEIEIEAEKFMKDYTKKLNTGYEVSDFSALQYYFEDKNSDVAQHIKMQVESKKKSEFSNPQVKSYERNDTEIKLVLSKKDEKGNIINSKYELVYDYQEKDFKIKGYTDI
ncbi:hypothetical protein NAC36_002446 [Staphylococcus pseudintermedius]|uniref:TcaA second domain-containing protein n=1 Tax=Bacillati TaxID=1783272 RepID=UPI000BBC6741|nr:hypothetical protein [Staphylococcus pseudintermedius]EGQ2789546.1 hypothetical protein [Staphylococcus pseudintermedius]EGQ2899986.1 hypothetical protein [Staphylococcus pseudintermedius]EGQ3068777.1 hypothetical protein [Staphylococcus pseudintermedius]EGQ3075959.1 hypothetical protein [Staphylococcus pseudintermedius]EGQ3318410.1 hypothetical protein [Staphylococcus pseudintermedius]